MRNPDQNMQLLYGYGGELNYNGYCSAEVDALIERQSSEADPQKRKQDRRATCWQPRVKGLTLGLALAAKVLRA